MRFKPTIHGPYTISKISTGVKYTSNGKKRAKINKIANDIARAFLVRFADADVKTCDCKRILKMWKKRVTTQTTA